MRWSISASISACSSRGSRAPADDYDNLSDDELAARIRIVVAELQRIGIDVASLFGIGEAGLGGKPPARPH